MQKVSEREIQNKGQGAILGFRDGKGGELTTLEDCGKEGMKGTKMVMVHHLLAYTVTVIISVCIFHALT